MNDKQYISWEEFHRHVKQLAEKIKKEGVYRQIIAVSRGGLLPAGILAYELNVRNCQSLNMVSYDGAAARRDEDVEILDTGLQADEQTLIVDDLSDSGRTFRLLRRLYPKARYVTVYSKPAGRSQVDLCAAELPDRWVVFPWDVE